MAAPDFFAEAAGYQPSVPTPPDHDPVSEGWRWNARPQSRPKAKDGQVQGRRKGFFLTEDPRTGQQVEKETYGCGHCQRTTILEHADRLDDVGVFCLACMRPCCKTCAGKMATGGMCEPFEVKHEREAARQESLRSMGL